MKGSVTLAASKQARVFRSAFDEDRNSVVYGCLYRRNRRVELGEEGDCIDFCYVDHIRLAGRFVGYVDGISGRGGHTFSVDSRDLRTGRVKHSSDWPDPGFDWVLGVHDLELRASGTIAWIQSFRESPDAPADYSVRKMDAEGEVVLARGADIEPTSLALSGSYLYWSAAGQAYSAGLR